MLKVRPIQQCAHTHTELVQTAMKSMKQRLSCATGWKGFVLIHTKKVLEEPTMKPSSMSELHQRDLTFPLYIIYRLDMIYPSLWLFIICNYFISIALGNLHPRVT